MVQLVRPTYQALGDYIWVEAPPAELMAGELHLPQKQKERPFVETTVLSVGDKITTLQPGDRILVNYDSVKKFIIDGQRLAFTKIEMILAKVKPIGAGGPPQLTLVKDEP